MYDEETEELSDDVIQATGAIADLTKTAEHPNGISLWEDAAQTEYKPLLEYLRELASIWDELEAKNQTEIIDKLFGKHGASVGSAILTNFDQVEAALAAMEDAEGSADSEMSIITESLEYKMNNLRETWTGIAQDVFNRDDLGGFIDGLAKVSEGLGWIIDKLGLLGTVATGLGGFLGFKYGTGIFDVFKENNKKKYTLSIIPDILTLDDKLLKGKITVNQFGKELNKIDFSKATNEFRGFAKQLDQGQISIQEFTNKAKQIQNTTVTLGGSLKNLGKQILSGLAGAGISSLISLAINAIVSLIDQVVNRAKYIKEEMQTAFTEFESIKEEYESINSEIQTNKDEMSELESLGSAITSQEQARLDTLREQTAELERQAYFKEQDLKAAEAEAAESWEDYFKSNYYDEPNIVLQIAGGLADIGRVVGDWLGIDSDEYWWYESWDQNIKTSVIQQEIDNYNDLIEKRKEFDSMSPQDINRDEYQKLQGDINASEQALQQYLSEATEGIEYFEKLGRDSLSFEQEKEYKQLLDWQRDISLLLDPQGYKDTIFDTIIKGTDDLTDNMNMLKKVQGQTEVSTEMLMSVYPRLASTIADTGFTVDEFITYLNESILAEEEAAAEAAKLGKTYDEVIENSGEFLDTLEALNGFEWTGFTGDSFSLEDFQSEDMQKLFAISGQKARGEIEGIEADPEYWREYGQYIEMVNGRLVINTDLLKENEEILKQQELDGISSALKKLETDYADNTRLINEYQDALRDANAEQVQIDGKWISQDTIDSLYEANSAISLQIDNLHLYAQAIKESSDAWNEWEAAQSSEDQGLYADESVNALNLINQTLNDTEFEDWRKTGTDQYEAALKLFLPEGTELDTKDLDAAQQLLEKYKKYYIAEYDEDTGLATYNKIDPYAVVSDMISAGYIESYMEDDQEKYRLTGQYTMEQIAEGMQLGLPFIEAVFGELSEYDIDFDWADEDPSQMFENLADTYQKWVDAVNSGDEETANKLKEQLDTNAEYIARADEETKKEMGFEGAESKEDVISTYEQEMYNSGKASEAAQKTLAEFEKVVSENEVPINIGINDEKANEELKSLAATIEGYSEQDKIALGFTGDATAEEIYAIGAAYNDYAAAMEQANKVAELKSQTNVDEATLTKAEERLYDYAEEIASLPDYVQTYYGFDPTDNADEIIDQINSMPEDKVITFTAKTVDLNEANQKLKDLGLTETTVNFSAEGDVLDAQIDEFTALLDTFKNEDGAINIKAEGAQETQNVLLALIRQKQSLEEQPAIMTVDISQADASVQKVIGIFQNFESNYQNLSAYLEVGADTSGAEAKLSTVISEIAGLDQSVIVSLGLDNEDFQNALTTLQENIKVGAELDPTALETIRTQLAGIDNETLNAYINPEGFDLLTQMKAIYDEIKNKIVTIDIAGTLQTALSSMVSWYNSLVDKTVTITKNIVENVTTTKSGDHQVMGTAHSGGTAHISGTAYARGTWGLATGGRALVGELGKLMPPYAVMCTCKFI